jgi:hypothetical protein
MGETFEDRVAYAGRLDLCGATDEELAELEPVAELISIRIVGKGRTEEFASILGYQPPDGVEVISRRPLFLHPE